MAASPTIVIISAEAEWRVVRARYADADLTDTPFGETFEYQAEQGQTIIFVFGGWGKISAAASAQYAIDAWRPGLLVNLGTCGGFAGRVAVGDIILADRTIVYDIIERMGDADEAIGAYATTIDTAWAGDGLPAGVRRGLLLSADRDLDSQEIAQLAAKYDGIAADWESGAIAWAAGRNGVPVLILRGVTDLVDAVSGEVYGDMGAYEERAAIIMNNLLDLLPAWLERRRASIRV